jgi:hypothetical protein
MDFPYKNITDKELSHRFENLSKYTLTLTPVKNGYKIFNIPSLTGSSLLYLPFNECVLIQISKDEYLSMNEFSDRFNEKARMQVKRYDAAYSPFDYWVNNQSEIIKKVGSDRYLQREYIYQLYLEATCFRPSLMAGFIEFFHSKRVLDISAGYGDRLIGACAKGVQYYGADPNPLTQQGYQDIIKMFGNPDKHKIWFGGAETMPLDDYNPDLIFSSPPYFDLELYNINDPNQSTRHKDLDSWFDLFLMFSIKRAYSALVKGGKMCIIINNIRNKPDYVKRMIKEVNKIQGIKYLGVISYSEGNYQKKSPQPIWIWEK